MVFILSVTVIDFVEGILDKRPERKEELVPEAQHLEPYLETAEPGESGPFGTANAVLVSPALVEGPPRTAAVDRLERPRLVWFTVVSSEIIKRAPSPS